jgi:predicted DNA-binding transcriptional regulator AlpA
MSDPIVVLTVAQLEELFDRKLKSLLQSLPATGAKEVLTLEECAEMIGRTTKSVMKLVKEEGMPTHYISDREPRFFRSEVHAWLAARPAKPKELEV